jgi:flagellar hook-length control protein FliK
VTGQKDAALQKESKKEPGKDPAPQDADVKSTTTADPKPAKPGAAQAAANLADTRPGNVKPAAAQPAAAQPGNAQPGNAQPGNAQLADAQPADVKPGAAPADTARHGNADAKDNPCKIDDGGKQADTQTQVSPSQAQPVQAQPAPAPGAATSIIAAAPAHQATTATMTAASAPTPMPQHLDVGQQAFVPNMAALGVAIATRSLSGSRQFDIRLDPPELGRVDVRLSIDATGKASAHLSADQQQTLDLLQKDSSGLTRALRDAGLDVAQNGLNFSLRQQGGGDRSGFSSRGRHGGHQPLSAIARIGATHTSIPLSAAVFHGVADGRLDIKV